MCDNVECDRSYCLTPKSEKEREEPSRQDIQGMHIWLRGKGPRHASAVAPFNLPRRGGERKKEGESIDARTERYFTSASSLVASNLLFLAGESFL